MHILYEYGIIGTAWWFGTCFHLFVHSVGKFMKFIIPTDELHHFPDGWLNHQPPTVGFMNLERRAEPWELGTKRQRHKDRQKRDRL